MAENAGDRGSQTAAAGRTGLPTWVVGLVAGAILVGYGIFTYQMLGLTAKSIDGVIWDRALLIFRSVEALAFAAAGVVLGVQIQRSQVQAAETKLQESNAEFQRKAKAVKEVVSNTVTASPGVPEGGGGLESAVVETALGANATAMKNLKTAIDAIL